MDESKKLSLIRIEKYIAHLGYCSRRQVTRLIDEGRVKLNNEIVKTPTTFIKDSDKIFIDGVLIEKKEEKIWLFHKPRGVVTTHSDPEGRTTVFDLLPRSLGHVISVGRLDLNSEGLLIITNSSDFAHKAMMPNNGWKRVYHVKVFGEIPSDFFEKLQKEITVDEIRYKPMGAEYIRGRGNHNWIKLTLTEGKNREIRKVMEFFGLQVSKLIRVKYGPYSLGNIKVGDILEVEK